MADGGGAGGAERREQTADAFIAVLKAEASEAERVKYERYFPPASMRPGDRFIGVPMGRVFALAGEFAALSLAHIEQLLESDIHEARAAAVKVLALRASARGAREQARTESYELYLRRHDRIDSWDLVNLGAPYIIGPYLFDKPRDPLDRLAASGSPWERRTALYATIAFIRTGQTDDAFRIAERLIDDPHDSVQKAVGTVLRTAGDRSPERLRAVLDRHASTMSRVALHTAIEKLESRQREHYLAVGKG
ncbi:MAG TPA: DNA alkylation repair protein [Pseudolysinimonas sp.]